MLAQLLQALEFLHSNGIIHRDITPRNIGMNQKDFAIKLLDFGLARDILSNNDYTINKVFEDALEPRIGDNIGPLTKSDLLDLLTQMPTVDKIQRPTASELLGHAFLRIIDRKLRGRATRAVNTPEAENASAYAELTNTETFRWNPGIEL
ncbi:unnamed protein product, partial [Mesorhabditis spiculigera]